MTEHIIPQHPGPFFVLSHANQHRAKGHLHHSRRDQQSDRKQAKRSDVAGHGAGQIKACDLSRGLCDDKTFIPARPFAEVKNNKVAGLRKHQRYDHERHANGAQRKESHDRW